MKIRKLYNYSTCQVPFKDFSKDLIPFLDVSDEEEVEIVEYDVVVPTLGKASENNVFFIKNRSKLSSVLLYKFLWNRRYEFI